MTNQAGVSIQVLVFVEVYSSKSLSSQAYVNEPTVEHNYSASRFFQLKSTSSVLKKSSRCIQVLVCKDRVSDRSHHGRRVLPIEEHQLSDEVEQVYPSPCIRM